MAGGVLISILRVKRQILPIAMTLNIGTEVPSDNRKYQKQAIRLVFCRRTHYTAFNELPALST
jgi:hypothetical protein